MDLITARPALNNVDVFVKGVMLTFPSQFTCRMDVLQAVFLEPCEADLDAVNPDLSCFGDLRTEMNYSDLEGLHNDSDIAEANSGGPSAIFHAGRLINYKRLRQDRELIAEYIDVLAIEHTRGEKFPTSSKLTQSFRANGCFLDSVDISTLDLNWALAAEEVVTAALAGIAYELGMTSPFYKEETAPTKALAIHRHLNAYLDQLDKVTGTKARVAEMNMLTDELIGEILDEER
ncbi:hypothetical protein PVE_R2G0435 [Pseudomonas veronii 1YdBTEX2]|uniref:Uncharacterized protein n=1 Tax=Pseudomonas veronii 1YdBTEX2 TaxID=1295141 RepID=A0A1D3K8F0_PSEVE|nr:hypothetical protein PVE_R2G0435 [Pseudomonas veronii 1YdBTEX2]